MESDDGGDAGADDARYLCAPVGSSFLKCELTEEVNLGEVSHGAFLTCEVGFAAPNFRSPPARAFISLLTGY